jgi:hypothetical protein
MGWDEGSPQRAALHGAVGAAIAALGGGDALQGAAGAVANQLAIQQMTSYLEKAGYKPGTQEFAAMLKLASTAVGAVVGGGSGAATALDGTTYNYLNHQQLVDLQSKIDQCKGDRVCVETAKSEAEILSATQEKALIDGCNAGAVNCAKKYHDDISAAIDYFSDPLATKLGMQVDQLITAQNYVNNRSEWGLVAADNAVSKDGNMMIGIAASGATAGLTAGPGLLVAGAYEGIGTGAIWQFAATTRTGTALTTGAINLSSQLMKSNGDISQVNPIDVGAAALGGYLGYGGSMAWNGMVGFGVGMVQTEANNLYGNRNDSLFVGGLTSGVFTMLGYAVGDAVASQLRTPLFAPLSSTIWGNVISGGATEGSGFIFQKLTDPQDAK